MIIFAVPLFAPQCFLSSSKKIFWYLSPFQILGRPDGSDKVDWVIQDTLANFWRPNFEAPQVMKVSCTLYFTVIFRNQVGYHLVISYEIEKESAVVI